MVTAEKPTIRVAVATKGGGLVNQHFGHAKEFQIYEVDDTQALFLETRQATSYCQGGHGAEESLNRIVRLLADCQGVLVSKIGTGPDDRLREAGIEPVQVYDAIETAVLEFYQQWRTSSLIINHNQEVSA